MDNNNKILYLIHYINNDNTSIRLGSIILEYFLLKKNFDYIEPMIKIDILQNILNYWPMPFWSTYFKDFNK